MADSLFYYPMTLHRGTITAPVLAPFVKNLPPVSGVVEEIYVRTQDTNPAGQARPGVYSGGATVSGVPGGQGVFVWDSTDFRFRYVMPYTEVCAAVIAGGTLDIYYDLDQAGPVIPSGAIVYRNGQPFGGSSFTFGDNAVWATITVPSSGAGNVSSVNGQTPDTNGNVTLVAVSTGGAGQGIVSNSGALSGQFTFKTINAGQGVAVTSDTNTVTVANTGVLSIEDGHATTGEALFVTSTPDAGGAVYLRTLLPGPNISITVDGSNENLIIGATSYTLPVATSSVLGGVKQGAGVTIAGDGTLSANVLSVNSRGGAVTLTATDVGLPTDLLSGTGGTLASTYVPAYLLGAVNYKGAWNASTNTPSITTGSASAANKGYYYIVSVAGTTTVDGISTWQVGDWIISDGVTWSRVPVNQTVVSVSGQTGAVTILASDNSTASGTTLISNSGATTGNIKLKTIAAGAGITVGNDVNGNLLISSSISQGVTKVESVGTGVSTVNNDGTTGGIAMLKSLAAGNNITITPDAQNQTLTITAQQNTPATTTTLGSVIVKAGLAVDGSGNLSLAAPTGVNLGGVKAGANVAIAADGTISVAAPYALPAATTSVLGGVTVPASSGLTVTSGALGLTQATATQIGGVTVPATSGLTVTSGALGLTPATATQIGGVKIGSGITVAGDGTISVSSSSSGVTQVESVGTGVSLINNDGTTGGIAMVKSIAAGSNITITPDGPNQTLTITANQTITPATTTALGGVIVKAGLAVDGSGNLSLAAPSGVNIGGVKAGSGVSIASDGTISVTAVGGVSSVSGQTGAVVVSATNNNSATGTTLISDSGATTGTIKLKTLVAGTNVTLTADGNGNLIINSTGGGGGGYVLPAATSTTLGGVIVPSNSGLAVDGSGNLTNAGITSLTLNAATQTGAVTLLAGSGITFVTSGNSNTIEVTAGTLTDAPIDGNEYVRQNAAWVAIPNLSTAIVSLTSDSTAGSHSLLEASPPANTAVTKSISAGTNVTITDNGSNLVITANVPGVVASVNNVAPNGTGNVTLTAANVAAVPIAGGVTMTGPLSMGSQVLNGIPAPVNPTDAVPYQTITGMSIDGGVIG